MRKLVMGLTTGVAVVGLSAAAFAAGTSDSSTTDPSASTTTTVGTVTTSTTTTTTTAAPLESGTAPTTTVPTSTVSSDTGTSRSTDGCGDGTYANHGAFVSEAAHDPDRAPGDVSAAAHSDCGKPLAAAGGASDDAPTDTEPATPTSDDDGAGPKGSHGNGNGKVGRG